MPKCIFWTKESLSITRICNWWIDKVYPKQGDMKEVAEMWTASSVYQLPSSVGNIWMRKKTIKQQQNMFTIPSARDHPAEQTWGQFFPHKCQNVNAYFAKALERHFWSHKEMKEHKESSKYFKWIKLIRKSSDVLNFQLILLYSHLQRISSWDRCNILHWRAVKPCLMVNNWI